MNLPRTNQSALEVPLRAWPGVAAVALQWLILYGVPIVFPEAILFAMVGGLGLGVVVVVWWLFFSRVPWIERLGAIVLMIIGMAATSRVVHESIANGMMGIMLFVYAIPVLSLALALSAVAGRRLSAGPRRASMVAAILLACGVFTLLRTGGITGDGDSDFHWRWTQTPEARLLAETVDEPAALPRAPTPTGTNEGQAPVQAISVAAGVTPGEAGPALAADQAHEPASPAEATAEAEWPGFRGPERDGVVRGVRIETDWSRTPPVELWRRPVGPGWSSFAVRGDVIYTQEQRGEDEIVSAYSLTSGDPVWRHRTAARFWESNGGAGPRGTPTVGSGRVYAFGATGILNALDARHGTLVWSRNVASETGRKVPDWGFASSPLVVGDIVVIAAAGTLAAYDAATGNPRWAGPFGGWGYSSPHLTAIGGVAQILLMNGLGAISVAPADGTMLWKHDWQGDSIVQPAVLADGDILIGSGSGLNAETGMRRLTIARGPNGWTAEERWTSNGLKPYFNDFVVHKGHAFGFDGSILASIDLQDGKRKWKGGRYGHGQLVLLPEQDLLLVLSEEGELALVAAAPDKFTEIARTPVIEGKTWNHPVIAGNILLVRNGEEMAAFRLR